MYILQFLLDCCNAKFSLLLIVCTVSLNGSVKSVTYHVLIYFSYFFQRQLSRRDSKTSITSSWSSLFNVVSNENLSAIEQDTGTYRGRSRKE